MGGAKSWWLCAEIIKLSLQYPGNRGYLCRNIGLDLKKSTLVTFEAVCPPGLIKNHYREDRAIELLNGSLILYGGLGGQEDLERIKSTEFGWFAIEEASETIEEMFVMLCTRLRWTLPGGGRPKYCGLLTSNPEPGWVKERFVDSKRDDYAFIQALPKDNPHLPPDYDSDLRKNLPEEWVKRYLDGSWDVFEGQIYKEFDRDVHVFKGDFDHLKFGERIRGIDHGYTNPTCCLWAAMDYEGRMLIYREHYERQLTVKENAGIIVEHEPNFDGITIADPSIFNKTRDKDGKGGWSVADEYREHGIVCISPYSADGYLKEGLGINLVKQRLKEKTLLIHESCENTIREILKYRWRDLRLTDRGTTNAPEIPVDVDNHSADVLRYLTVWRPPGSRPPVKAERKGVIGDMLAKLRNKGKEIGYAGWN